MTTTKIMRLWWEKMLMTFPSEMAGRVFLAANRYWGRSYEVHSMLWVAKHSFFFSWIWICKGPVTNILPVAHFAGQVIFTCQLPRDKFCPGITYLLYPDIKLASVHNFSESHHPPHPNNYIFAQGLITVIFLIINKCTFKLSFHNSMADNCVVPIQ